MNSCIHYFTEFYIYIILFITLKEHNLFTFASYGKSADGTNSKKLYHYTHLFNYNY